jgi:branched-chain amino acid transport system permease protein
MVRKGLLIATVLAGIAGLQLLLGATLDPYVIRVLSVCGINVMLAVALNLVNGTTGQFSIGHAGFMAVVPTRARSPRWRSTTGSARSSRR